MYLLILALLVFFNASLVVLDRLMPWPPFWWPWGFITASGLAVVEGWFLGSFLHF